jgi:hypothetical protein
LFGLWYNALLLLFWGCLDVEFGFFGGYCGTTCSGGIYVVFLYFVTSTVGAVNYYFLDYILFEIATYYTLWFCPESCFFKGNIYADWEVNNGFLDWFIPGITPVAL